MIKSYVIPPKVPHFIIPGQNFDRTIQFFSKYLRNIFILRIFKQKITQFKTRKEVKKNFFGGPDVPVETEYMRVEYDSKFPVLPRKMAGAKTFDRIFQAGQASFELFCLERKIYGPCWLSVAKFEKTESSPVSWCKEEYKTSEWKSCSVHSKNNVLKPPKLTLMSLTLMSAPKRSSNELIAFSMLVNESFKMDEISKARPRVDKHIHGLSKLDGHVFPYDWDSKKTKLTDNLESCTNEKHLVNFLLNSIRTVDPDIILGHDVLDFGFEFLLQRIKICGVSNWSRLGRIRRKEMPKFGGNGFGSSRAGFSAAIGRLVTDIKISAMELVKQKDYGLTALAEEQIPKRDDTTDFRNRTEYGQDLIQKAFQKSSTLRKLTDEIRYFCQF